MKSEERKIISDAIHAWKRVYLPKIQGATEHTGSHYSSDESQLDRILSFKKLDDILVQIEKENSTGAA